MLTLAINTVFAKKLFPDLNINFRRHFNRDILIMIIRFGSKIQITNLTQLFVFQIDKMLISHYFGLYALSNYEIANRLATQARSLIASIFIPMTPAASALQASQEDGRVANLYRRSFKYMSIITVPFCFLVIVLAHPFVNAWMDPIS